MMLNNITTYEGDANQSHNEEERKGLNQDLWGVSVPDTGRAGTVGWQKDAEEIHRQQVMQSPLGQTKNSGYSPKGNGEK